MPISFTQRIQNIYYNITKQKERQVKRGAQILFDITAELPTGKLIAIMGTSGSGKSTLLNVLSGRLSDGDHSISLSGSSLISISPSSYLYYLSRYTNRSVNDDHIQQLKRDLPLHHSFLFSDDDLDDNDDNDHSNPFYPLSDHNNNNKEKEKKKKKKKRMYTSLMGYVLQHDHLLPNLTAYETLLYAGLIRLPQSLSTKEKKKIINKVMMELGLADCANIRVGGDGKYPSLSGGERRRVSIGIQMLTDPSLIFFDEPTTGLDSFTSNKLILTLRNIAHNSNRTIVCTIHQPRADIFQMMDSILLLSKGKLVYFGDGSDHILHYFASIGYPCPDDMNPADFFCSSFFLPSPPSYPPLIIIILYY